MINAKLIQITRYRRQLYELSLKYKKTTKIVSNKALRYEKAQTSYITYATLRQYSTLLILNGEP